MQKPLRRHKIGRKASLSSVMLHAPTLMADFELRNRRGIEEKMMCTALPFFLLLSRAPEGAGEMGYELAALVCAGDQAGTRWPLYVLTKNITYNKLYPYFSLEYQGWGTELRPVSQISQTSSTGKWEHQLFFQTYEQPNVSQSPFDFQVLLLPPFHSSSQLCSA